MAEIIWNGLDADASRVDVRLTHYDFGLSAITVADNGHGIPHQDAGTVSTRLGGSWKKRGGFTKSKNRMLHGFEGRGRFKVFALGRVADWNVAYRADGQDTETYTISIIESNIRDGEVRISDKQASKNGPHSGVEVTISELHRDFRS